jgi:hypothetical protein
MSAAHKWDSGSAMNEAIAAVISLVTAIAAAVVTTSWRMRAERR